MFNTANTTNKKSLSLVAIFAMLLAMLQLGIQPAHAVNYTVDGTVRWSSTASSDLLGNALVEAIKSDGTNSNISTTTDVTGRYSLSLPADTYTIKISKVGHVTTYLGNVSTLASATTFVLSANVASKDVVVPRQGSITGSITGDSATTTVWVHKTDGTIAASGDVSHGTAATTYTISNIDPGTYYVRFTSTANVTEWSGDQPSFSTASAVSVTSGNATTVSAVLTKNSEASATVAFTTAPTISGDPIEGLTLTANATVPAGYYPNYQWASGGTDIAGALKSTYVVTSDDAGRTITVKVFLSRIGYLNTATMTSAATAAATHAFVTAPVPTITGTPTVTEVLTANTGTWSPAADTFAYQWYYGGAVIPGATSSTWLVTSTTVGYAITVKVTAYKAGYPSVEKLSAATALVGNLIAVAPNPTITGTAAVGKTLTAVPGVWSPNTVSFSYQWKRNGTAIAGATSSQYTLVAADLNTYISVTVTGSQATYTSKSATSSSTSAVLDKLTVGNVAITGNTTVGSTITADPGVWGPSPVTLSYQWYRNNVAISGATATTYTLVAADDLTNITVVVTGTKSGYGDDSKTSAPFAVGKQFVNHNAPTIKGNLWVGQTLKITVGSWDSVAVLTHQWFRDGVAITGATAHSYRLTTADIGKKITASTTGTAAGYISKTSTSIPTAVILNGKPFTKKATPVITGSLKVGKTLGVNRGYWNPTPTKVYYQWLRNLVPIAGATKSTYKLATADKGTSIRVKITVVRSGYATTSMTSRPSSAIK